MPTAPAAGTAWDSTVLVVWPEPSGATSLSQSRPAAARVSPCRCRSMRGGNPSIGPAVRPMPLEPRHALADVQDRNRAATLFEALQEATGDSIELFHVNQG